MREKKGSLATVEEFAAGILSVVETQMEKAIRVIRLSVATTRASSRWWQLAGAVRCTPVRWRALCGIPTVLVPPCRVRCRRLASCWRMRFGIIRGP